MDKIQKKDWEKLQLFLSWARVFFWLVSRSTRMLMQTELLDTCRCEDDKAESDAEKYFIRDRTISPRLEQIVFVALHN